MKRFLSVILSLLLAISCPLVTFAAEEKKLTNEELYACYQEIIEKSNEKYGYSFSLVDFDDIPFFWPVDEFQNMVEEYCWCKKEKAITITPLLNGQSVSRANKVVTASNVVTETHRLDTITITFYGTFDIKQNTTTGSHYVDGESYTVYTRSQNGIVTYEPHGTVTIETYDHGRSHYAVQEFRVLVYGSFEEYSEASAGFYISPATGNVTPLST